MAYFTEQLPPPPLPLWAYFTEQLFTPPPLFVLVFTFKINALTLYLLLNLELLTVIAAQCFVLILVGGG